MDALHNWPEEYGALQEKHVALTEHCKKLEVENARLREENEGLKNAPADHKAWSAEWNEDVRKSGYQDSQ